MADVMDLNKECCLCLHVFTEPRVLPCLHTFCLKCLDNMGSPIPNDWLLCPVCGSKFIVPEDGLTGLPKNIFAEKSTAAISTFTYESADNPSCDACGKPNLGDKNVAEKYCINCEENLCLKCCAKHNEENKHLVVVLSSRKKTNTEEETEAFLCRDHQEEIPKLFCTFCKKVICDKCFHESHSSHSCTDVTAIGSLVCKLAAKELNVVETMQLEFQERMEKLHKEQMIFLEKIKRIETQILKRCEEVKELVVKETKAMLQELAVLKSERLEEIEVERRRLDRHSFTLEKFKEYCAWIKSNGTHNFTCEAESLLRTTSDELRVHEKSRIENRIFPLQFEFQKTDIREFVMHISRAIGKVNVIYPYKMDLQTTINTNNRILHGMAILQDKLYLLSDSVLIYRADKPYDCVGEIKIPDIKSSTSILSCCQTSRLYVYDKGNKCIWKVSVPDHQVTRWLDKVKDYALGQYDIIKEQCNMSVTPTGEIIIVSRNSGTLLVTVEIYDENAILTERVEIPKDSHSINCVYRTPSGNYLGFGGTKLYKFRADGSTVGDPGFLKFLDYGGCVRCLEVTPYNVFLISSPPLGSWGFRVSLITCTLDMAVHSTLLESKEEILLSACYIKTRKRLAVLKHFRVNIGNNKMEPRQGVTVYNIL